MTQGLAHIKVDAIAVGLIVEHADGQVDRVYPDGDAGEGRDDAGQEEDEEEEHRASLHRDPVLDDESKDVGDWRGLEENSSSLLLIVITVNEIFSLCIHNVT